MGELEMRSDETTSDGIPLDEWDIGTTLAAEIANSVGSNDDKIAELKTQELLRHLKELEKKYGILPSILATRADYTDNDAERISLLNQALQLAVTLGDKQNALFIISSLAETYIMDLHDIAAGKIWLARLEKALEDHWNDTEYGQLIWMRESVEGSS